MGYIISSYIVVMDEGKVLAVTTWPKLTTTKELQRFLGFAIFYRHYIRGFSLIAEPLTHLKKAPKTLTLNYALS